LDSHYSHAREIAILLLICRTVATRSPSHGWEICITKHLYTEVHILIIYDLYRQDKAPLSVYHKSASRHRGIK